MKKYSYSLVLFFFLSLGFSLSSCSEEAVAEIVSEEEAAEVVIQAVAGEAEGMTAEVETAAANTETYAYASYCGMSFDSTLHYAASTGIRSYDYTLSWTWALTCTNLNVPSEISYSSSTTGSYEVVRMASQDGAAHSFTLSGLNPGSSTYTYNGTYTRQGSQQSKIRNQTAFSSTLQITASNVTLSKSTQEITGGTATVTVSGASTAGNSFSYPGQIVFHGNRSATLTLNGNTYPIQW